MMARLGAASLTALALVLALAGASGCGGDGDGGTRLGSLLPRAGGGSLAYALPSLPSTLDPLAAQGRDALTVTRQIHEPLVERLTGPYGQAPPQPGLALNARPSPDRSTWTVTPRSGVRFQDGTPFNAAAVLANSRRWSSDPAGQRLLPHLFAVDAPRPDEVRFLLDKPIPGSPQAPLASRGSGSCPHGSRAQERQNARFVPGTAHSGTGAFQAGTSGPGRLEPRASRMVGSAMVSVRA